MAATSDPERNVSKMREIYDKYGTEAVVLLLAIIAFFPLLGMTLMMASASNEHQPLITEILDVGKIARGLRSASTELKFSDLETMYVDLGLIREDLDTVSLQMPLTILYEDTFLYGLQGRIDALYLQLEATGELSVDELAVIRENIEKVANSLEQRKTGLLIFAILLGIITTRVGVSIPSNAKSVYRKASTPQLRG